ncbi:MAG TPA: NAD-dependent epimerase/dehydratase family protein [Alphaproteobacteria bacterium]|nr:NAD-dependent epimerase/dehydratase family protein [Alphaproteobacteria bacterium]
MKVALLGATSKTGRYVVPVLCDHGHTVVAIGRDTAKLGALDRRARAVHTDITDAASLRAALEGVECVASLAHARYTAEILAALPATCRRVVLTGSVRKFTQLPDPAADAVRAGEARLLASGRAGVMLHPSMIYGAPEERNVNRILTLLARFPAWLPVPVPLPDGGRNTVQPVFVDDMVAAVVAAIEKPEAEGPPVVVAGPRAITYREMVERCAAVVGRRVVILPLPLSFLKAALRLVSRLGIRLPFTPQELVRATENKSFDVSALEQRLGIRPRPFEAGLTTVMGRRAAAQKLDARSGAD